MLLRRLSDWWNRVRSRSETVDAADWQEVCESMTLLRGLTPESKNRLQSLVETFLADKVFEAARGFEITPRIRLAIALQACLPILELGLDWYDGWKAVIVYPAGFAPERIFVDEYGVEHQVREELAGEAWDRGPVVLSWEDAEHAGREDGYNPVIHEFVHKLDLLNGDVNGFPPLHTEMKQADWTAAFSAAYEDFCRLCDRGEYIGIDEYASTSPGEFFAVISESFFEQPDLLQQSYPDVYTQLSLFYRQDPLARLVNWDVRH